MILIFSTLLKHKKEELDWEDVGNDNQSDDTDESSSNETDIDFLGWQE